MDTVVCYFMSLGSVSVGISVLSLTSDHKLAEIESILTTESESGTTFQALSTLSSLVIHPRVSLRFGNKSVQ